MRQRITQFLLFMGFSFIAHGIYAAMSVSDHHEIIDGYTLAFYVCCSIAVFVFGVLIYSLIKFRRSRATHFHKHLSIEIIWTMVPFILLVALIWPATRLLHPIHQVDPSRSHSIEYRE